MKTKTICQTMIITGAFPHDLYEIFMDETRHAGLLNSSAKINREIGKRFEIYDGYIDGTNIELVQDKKIVQDWRAGRRSIFRSLKLLLKKKRAEPGLLFSRRGCLLNASMISTEAGMNFTGNQFRNCLNNRWIK